MRFIIPVAMAVTLGSGTAHALSASNSTEKGIEQKVFIRFTLDAADPILAMHPGAKAYQQFCSHCHDLPHPRLHTQQEWKTVMERMRQHMLSLGVASPTDEQQQLIMQFLQDNKQH